MGNSIVCRTVLSRRGVLRSRLYDLFAINNTFVAHIRISLVEVVESFVYSLAARYAWMRISPEISINEDIVFPCKQNTMRNKL